MSVELDLTILRKRALMLSRVRQFFARRKIMEVDCSLLLKSPTVDANIKCFRAENFYLPISLEFSLKKLLTQGIDALYSLNHVFRKEEIGRLHKEEFMMIEWYCKDISFSIFFNNCIKLIELFLGKCKLKKYRYFELLEKFFNIKDYKKTSKKKLIELLHVKPHGTISKEGLLTLLLDQVIKEHFTENCLYMIYDYPAMQSLFARWKGDIAERFELYYNDIELLNGCHELNDSEEQKKRLLKLTRHLDEDFLNSLDNIGNCYGAAAGFDRLLMLHCKKENIQQVMI